MNALLSSEIACIPLKQCCPTSVHPRATLSANGWPTGHTPCRPYAVRAGSLSLLPQFCCVALGMAAAEAYSSYVNPHWLHEAHRPPFAVKYWMVAGMPWFS